MSSDKKGDVKLPDGWVLCTSKSNPGRKYYFNRKTGKSSWTEPQANEKCDRKHKGKKEKVNKEKAKREEQQKAHLKRKSDSQVEQTNICRKKQRKEATSTNHQTTKPTARKEEYRHLARPSTKHAAKPAPKSVPKPVNQTAAPTKPPTPQKDSPEKPTPNKNAANNRLSQLRNRLSKEAQDESNSTNDSSPQKPKPKISPKPTPAETKTTKTENRSPNINEQTCTTSSPSSDSLQSAPSPSQFFAANKIIYSMKAQLPEEYCDKTKPKDTFADIEQGITNQTSEYPYMKHPATPPQFSEASKLVSAIKSKLTKEASVKAYGSANERLGALRTSLTNDVMETNENDSVDINKSNIVRKDIEHTSEAMDVDCKETKQAVPVPNCTKDNSSRDVVFVVDTNIFIHELDIIKTMLNSNINGYSEQPILLVPKRVVNELDRLKDNNNCNGVIWKRARAAMNYLYDSLPLPQSRIRGQSLRDANSHIYPCESPDDEILNCCLQQAERGMSVVLLSSDKNLCSKAMINSIKSLGLTELNGLLTAKAQETDPDLFDNLKHYQASIYQLLANILENEMRAKYNNLWQHVLLKAPPWTLADVLRCLLKHWAAVFNEVFPRIEHLIINLKTALANVDSKTPSTLTESEVTSFRDLCLDIAKKCQIIPEYMELAKLTVDRIVNDRVNDDEENSEMIVIDAFESVWTVMSSYCAKLSSMLGVAHNIEDKLPGEDSLQVLTSKLNLFGNQISSFTLALRGVLNSDSSESSIEEQVSQLERVFKHALTLICMDTDVINKNNLRMFCTKCRNMLQEAYLKFSQLTELVEICKNTMNCT